MLWDHNDRSGWYEYTAQALEIVDENVIQESRPVKAKKSYMLNNSRDK